MSPTYFDIFVAKEYESRQNGTVEKKTKWNKVGHAWTSKSAESLSFELYLLPQTRYVIQLRDRNNYQENKSEETKI